MCEIKLSLCADSIYCLGAPCPPALTSAGFGCVFEQVSARRRGNSTALHIFQLLGGWSAARQAVAARATSFQQKIPDRQWSSCRVGYHSRSAVGCFKAHLLYPAKSWTNCHWGACCCAWTCMMPVTRKEGMITSDNMTIMTGICTQEVASILGGDVDQSMSLPKHGWSCYQGNTACNSALMAM